MTNSMRERTERADAAPTPRDGARPDVVVGISAGFHDSAACVVVDGVIVAAVEQERLSRIKHDPAFPADAVATCLEIAGLTFSDVDVVAVNEKPILVLQRYLSTRIRSGPRSVLSAARGLPSLVQEHLRLGQRVDSLFRAGGARSPRLVWVEHHVAHASAAFYPSPFRHAAILTVDGVGEWATATTGQGAGSKINLTSELRFPNSLGLLYSAFTSYCGFRVNSGEGELMGLAPYGTPRFESAIWDHLVTLEDDGSITLDQRYFDYLHGKRMTNGRFHELFDGEPLALGAEPTEREADLAASVQAVTERTVMSMATHAMNESGESNLCLAGGVALNCVANGRVARETRPDGLWIQPAAGDGGGALGAALHAWHQVLDAPRTVDENRRDAMSGAYLGPSFTHDEVQTFLTAEGVTFESPDPDQFTSIIARHLDEGAVVGWFSGRMEFGPRALGARSILADPRRADIQPRINQMIKERQTFRPFAPAVLAEHADEWFDGIGSSPYMLLTAPVADRHLVTVGAEPTGLVERTDVVRSSLPAVTHVDGSARVQTVDDESNPTFRRLLGAFHDLTGCPVLLNTSFNGRSEPIVCSPDHALATAQRVGLDILAIEGCIVDLRRQEHSS